MLRIDSRYNGPPDSGNGGYCCGYFALALQADPLQACEVTLRAPPPLETQLQATAVGDGLEVRDGDVLVATVAPGQVDFEALPPPDLAAAKAAESRYAGFEGHPFATCFVCGPERAEGDGLRLFPGNLVEPAQVGEPVACHWHPGTGLAGDSGHIKPEFVWAALDCPTFFGAFNGRGMVPAVLGRQAVRLLRTDLPADAIYTIQSWSIGTEGRKSTSLGALYDASGECVALCRATWVELQAREA